MYLKNLFSISLLIVLIAGCRPKPVQIPVSQLKFYYYNAIDRQDSLHLYSLVGRGLFFSQKYQNELETHRTDSLIKEWLEKHPAATVTPVTDIKFKLYKLRAQDTREAKKTYCWIIDNTDTLNNYLVRNGCFPKLAMSVPRNLTQILGEKNKDLEASMEFLQYDIPENDIKRFYLQIGEAEKYARENHLGIHGH